MKTRLELRSIQSLAPATLFALEVLGMGNAELCAFIDAKLNENPLLKKNEFPQSRDEGRILTYTGDEYDRFANISAEDDADTLSYYLRMQLPSDISPSVRKAALFIIDSLDESGYLRESDAELAALIPCTLPVLKAALNTVMAMEPCGVAARTLSECLCLQLKRTDASEPCSPEPGVIPLALRIAKNHLELLAQGNTAALAAALNASVSDVEAASELIRSLTPRPGAGFSKSVRNEYIVPDIRVSKVGGAFSVTVLDDALPKLTVDEEYIAMLSPDLGGEAAAYLRANEARARWLIRGIEQRRLNMLRCAEAIVNIQQEFFSLGRGALRPASLGAIGSVIGVAPSTVSRIIKDKYIECDFGIFPMRRFLVRRASAASDAPSAESVRERIAALIADESASHPLSDEHIVSLLKKSGVLVARRTVAKYRSELGIPSSVSRRGIIKPQR